MADWPEHPLQDVAFFQEGPGILAKDFVESGTPLVRLAGLGGYQVTLTGCNFVADEKAETKWKHFKLEVGDILVSTSASFGRPAVVGPEAEGAIFYTGLIRFRSSTDELDDGYLKLFLGSREFDLQAEAFASGSVIRHFGPSHLRQMTIQVPPKDLQRQIVNLIGALDDKIELNRRINETLEAMARAIFKDWFVDFGPTRAKAEDRAPYLAPDLWDLFPDALDDGDKPVGWEIKPLDEIAHFLNGLALQKFPASDAEDSLPVIKIAELRGGITAKSNRASREVPEKYVVADGDFLFSWSGSLLAKFWTEGEGALNQHLFKVTSDRYPAWFFSQWVHHHLKEFRAIAASKATTMGHIQRGHLKEAMTICPPNDVLSILGQTVGPLVDRTIKNELEARTLAKTRDLLLPKLMSGEIRLAEAEKVVGAVA